MKTCSKCGETKPVEDFYFHSGNQCKACKVRIANEWYANNRERFNANQRRRNNLPGVKERKAAYLRQYNLEHKEELAVKARARTIMRKYGLSVERYDAMILEQRNACAICKREEPLAVDHDHRTGAVRALLCHACNRTLGAVDDDADRLRAMIAYLHAHQALSTSKVLT